MEDLKSKFLELSKLIDDSLPPVKATMIAKDRLTEALLWVKSALETENN